ncbi:MAG: ankyrin repeat domain-containing protein [Gammaproteobacteria bacterium]
MFEGEQDNRAGLDEQSEGIQRVSATSLTQFFNQLIDFKNAESTVFQKLPNEFKHKVTQTLDGWYGLDIQAQILRLDEFVEKRDDIVRDLATTYFKQYEGYTMLTLAASKGKDQIVEALLVAGAPVDEAGNKYKKTALLWGVYFCNWNIVRVCIEHKANTQLKDSNGVSALEHAEKILPHVGNVLGMSDEERRNKPAECSNIIALLKQHSPSQSTGVYHLAPGLGTQPSAPANARNSLNCSIQ